jgi:glycosyltransferase involved in cell wall biosynthesis
VLFRSAFRVADAFVLPSHQENFGIAVVEALACGLPVLITDKVNIWREIAKAEAGFVEADTLGGVAALLQRWLSAPSEAVERMRERARTCFERHFEIRQAARKLVDVIETCLEAGALSTTRAMEE